ncbi:beta-ketoacyl synthase N-terminal-like domain-containing protein [Nostoc favosum]|uniref:Cupin-like domain-containing protein n=1 Tax=Nostoc favosum CHAB5714 TaxID=2780399 RepID=A0ABS8IGL9_9NOSO|nr:cupin-like domain-containing protein [Nostoc favosum CHAB5714]
MAGRFPGAKSVEQFWQNLCDGVESISFFTDDELLNSSLDPTLLRDPNYVKARAVLEDIEMLDASFFGFTPREATLMDPQHRLFLECAWEALENAGYNPEADKELTGVYAGASLSSYLINNLVPDSNLSKSSALPITIGNDKDYLSTRVSYKLNLKGPSISVNTACSTSLVAVHLACQGLLSYQCDRALAGGVTIEVPHQEGYFYQKGGITSPDGHCRAFDAKAQGCPSGNGVGIVILKRLEDALADGDCIYAVIKGSAINNDGSEKVSFTAPSVTGQAEVIAEAQAIAGFDPETVTYIETHGTGTALGDPIEVRALKKAFSAGTNKKGFCAIGSVKTNVSHLNAAAGVAGLIKTVLALKHKIIPPTLHFEMPNSEIDFANSPFYVNDYIGNANNNSDYLPSYLEKDLEKFLPEIVKDVTYPAYFLNRKAVVGFWHGFSNKSFSSTSPLHFDSVHNIFTQIRGRKKILLFPPSNYLSFYPAAVDVNQGLQSFSKVDPNLPNLELFPKFPWQEKIEVLLQPGVMLYIPPFWWHHVTAVDENISLSFWYAVKIQDFLHQKGILSVLMNIAPHSLRHAISSRDGFLEVMYFFKSVFQGILSPDF